MGPGSDPTSMCQLIAAATRRRTAEYLVPVVDPVACQLIAAATRRRTKTFESEKNHERRVS